MEKADRVKHGALDTTTSRREARIYTAYIRHKKALSSEGLWALPTGKLPSWEGLPVAVR